jgi:uncharacterized membrane protein YkvA (DUF1232 family)
MEKKEKEVGADLSLDGFREHYSESRFWGKVGALPRNTGRAILEKGITLFVILSDTQTPAWARLLIVGVLGYFICPLDLVPDVVPVLGYVDDLAVMTLLAVEMDRFLTPAMRKRVQNLMPESMRQPTITE